MEIEAVLLQGHGNVGYGTAQNLAIRTARSDYHLLLNPDLELEEDFLATGIRYLENEQDISVVSPHAQYKNGQKQYLCKRYTSLLIFFLRGFLSSLGRRLFESKLAKYEMHELQESTTSKNIPIVSGCCMLCRTEKLQEIAGFDENYFLYFEDFDLSMRLQKTGGLAYVPAMKIVHHGGKSAAKGMAHIYYFARSGIRFFNTYGWQLL